MQRVRKALDESGATQTDLAHHLGLAKSTVSQIISRGQFPKGRVRELRQEINQFLMERGVFPNGIWDKSPELDEEEPQVLQEVCVMISAAAKTQFKIFKDPFLDDVNEAKDVFLGAGTRYVSEYMYSTARNGGMLAVIGESGSGKTTLRRLLIDRIKNESLKIKIISPRIIDKERLTATAICDSIIQDCSTEMPRRTLEAKARQIERILTDSSRSGFSHVLMIEEAHDLTIPTLKYLKRFWELEDGFKKLLSVILVAQPELKTKLDESRNFEAREIIRRMEIAELAPLNKEADLEQYLKLKFARVGIKHENVLDKNVYKAAIDKLTRKTRRGGYSMAYPLTVNNLIKQAMNTAADVGQPMVDADTLAAV